jgi:hypothetical protein
MPLYLVVSGVSGGYDWLETGAGTKMLPNLDIEKIRLRVDEALASAGETPWLVGYDANAIQELVTAGSRPIIMGAASDAIVDFDEREAARPGNIFAGGGRGISVVGSATAAEALVHELPAEFRRCTVVGVLAADAVPLELGSVRASLRWLRRKLDMAKDRAARPGGDLPAHQEDECVNCRSYRTVHSTKLDGRDVRVCERCHVMSLQGKGRERSTALVDVSACERHGEHRGRLASVSADGNNLGAFFDELDTLYELAAASAVVSAIFRDAQEQALAASVAACRNAFGQKDVVNVPLLTGGDDVRAFLPPSGLLAYVETLARVVENRAASMTDLNGLLHAPTVASLRRLGVGIGAVIAEDHFPARRLMQYAHELEKQAKSICRDPASGTRSAFDLEVVTSTQTVGVRLEHKRADKDGRPFPLAPAPWDRARAQARALRALPTAQRRVLDLTHTLDPAEFDNLFRYQVARSAAWQHWYELSGVDWRDPDALVANRPGAGLLALSSLLPEERS